MKTLRSEVVTPSINPRKNGDYWKYVPDFGYNIAGKHANLQENIKEYDVQGDTLQTTEVSCREEDSRVDGSLPSTDFRSRNSTKTGGLTNTRKYHRILSEPSVGFNQAGSLGFKRAASATGIRTRLLCPKGLLIATEPPKSGETYRRRSNTDVSPQTTKAILSIEVRNTGINNIQKGKESILLELEAVKYERCLLQKENKRLQEELDNRNRVIDHLIDYMKSNIPSGGGQYGYFFSDVDKSSSSDNSKKNSS